MKRLIVLILCSISIVGCARCKISKQLKEFLGQTITIPIDLLKITDGKNTLVGNVPEVPLMIFYHDSTSCSSCQIAHLKDYYSIYELSDSLGTFEVMTIFSPKPEEYDDVLRNIKSREFDYPVYVDMTGSFASSNGCIPSDKRFHSFLVDSCRHPVFVGDPISVESLGDLFEQVLEKLKYFTKLNRKI